MWRVKKPLLTNRLYAFASVSAIEISIPGTDRMTMDCAQAISSQMRIESRVVNNGIIFPFIEPTSTNQTPTAKNPSASPWHNPLRSLHIWMNRTEQAQVALISLNEKPAFILIIPTASAHPVPFPNLTKRTRNNHQL
jgi:hypothetical protein